MKKTLLALLPILALCTAASAQFTFTGFTGKMMKNSAKPDVRIREKDSSGRLLTTLEHYFVWGKDSIKVQSVNFDEDKPNRVRENIFYYADFKPNSTVIRSEATKSIECVLSSKGGATVPTWENTDVYYSEAMRDLVSLMFETQKQGDAFLSKLKKYAAAQKSTQPRRITLKETMKEKKFPK